MSIDTASVPPPARSHGFHRDEPLWEIVDGERVELAKLVLPHFGGSEYSLHSARLVLG